MLLAAFFTAGLRTEAARAVDPCPQKAVTPPSKTMPNGSESVFTEATCVYPTINFSASSYSVPYGGSTTVSWSVTNASNGCSADSSPPSSWAGVKPLNGSESVGPLTTNPTTLYLNCSNGIYGASGASLSISVGAPGGGGGGGGSCTENDPSQMHATFISSSAVPTGVTTGQSFSVSVTFQNTGQCAWVYGAGPGGYRLGAQNPENNCTWAVGCPGRKDLAPGEVVNPGQSKTFVINAIAPSTPGPYGWGWRLVREGVNWFGTPTNPTFLTIDVVAAAPPPPPPTVGSFTVSSQARWSDDPPATLTWSCTNSTSASIASDPTGGGSWGSLSPSGSLSVNPPAGGYTYTLTCSNSTGSAQADVGLAVFNADERSTGNSPSGQNTDRALSWDSILNCRWKSETNEDKVPTRIGGLYGGRLTVKVDWCVRNGFIRNVARAVINLDGPNYPLSSWHLEGVTSYGPCSVNCDNYVTLYGRRQTVKNIWMKARWRLCVGVRILGSVCIQDKTLTVGVRIHGDGTREDTYDDSTP